MKKVIVFLLTAAIALGGLGFAHATVTDAQDDLVIYPVAEIGDAGALEGMTASMTFACGDYLRWYTDYPFGGEAVTEFEYIAKGSTEAVESSDGHLEVYFTGGIGSSTSGTFSLTNNGYGALLRAVAAVTPNGGSKTMNLKMADYVDYYMPDYELYYTGEEGYCSQSASLHGLMTGDSWYEERGAYTHLMQKFRFPVQPDHIMSVTVDKNDAGGINGINLSPENGPSLHFISDVNDEGVWFVPIFLDENGAPLPYESPEGHGIYHIPWKFDSSVTYGSGKQGLTLDMNKVTRLAALDENVPIQRMVIDAEKGEAWMLTLEDGSYILTALDLTSGEATVRTEVLPDAPESGYSDAWFVEDSGYLLVTARGSVALVEKATGALLLTAPAITGQTYSAANYDEMGDLRFDGETLVLLDTGSYRHGAFWTMALRQDEVVYYGLYDCSIMRGNDDWYYSYISTEQDVVELNVP